MEQQTFLERLTRDLGELNEDHRKYVLAVSQALLFAQTVAQKPPPSPAPDREPEEKQQP